MLNYIQKCYKLMPELANSDWIDTHMPHQSFKNVKCKLENVSNQFFVTRSHVCVYVCVSKCMFERELVTTTIHLVKFS